MKKIMLLLICSFLIVSGFGQSISLPVVVGEAGSTVAVPLLVSDLEDIEAITLHIQFNPAVLTFTGCDLLLPSMLVGCYNGIIGLSWAELTPVTMPGNKLAVFYFETTGGTSSLDFVPICEIIQHPYVILDVEYTNGAVIPAPRKYDMIE